MKFALLFVVLFTLSSCIKDTNNNYEKNTSVVSGDSTTDRAINTETTPSTERSVLQEYPEYLAKNEGELSELDLENAYEMCVGVLTEYYQAVRLGQE
ncbi:hypothetical protein [Bacillus sp. REN16]|uniref:hypothetical protein n=1 Tax=Bacillus sp. REN16 TaxID=2887296 RepID=UPI001E2850FC|nr:hypothetical protein [Bacillus sp. REN16]MCC3359389.1 hypothetical protein [Bacillus sp. REN16]